MEKFALLNLLSALNGLTSKPAAEQPPANGNLENNFTGANTDNGLHNQNPPPAQQTANTNTYPNVMASVIERHEAISNRVKNKK